MTTLSWDPPGKGDWRGLHDHFPRALTPEYQLLLEDGMTRGEEVWAAHYGLPIRTLRPAFVHGRVFISAVPLLGRATDRVPPRAAMWLAVRLVPAFRRRAAAARRAVEERPWVVEARRWWEVDRPAWIARDEALAAVDPPALDDDGLVAHLREARALAGEGYRAHFRLHGCDLIPTGTLLVRAREWGLDPLEVAGLLAGSSPVSRGESALPGWCLVTGYDLDERCAAELPTLVVTSKRPAGADDAVAAAGARLREVVPEAERPEWDRLLADARATCGVRDDNGLLTAAWPVGLLRRAVLEVGRRLVERGRLHEPAHAVELTVDELVAAIEGVGTSDGPSADDAAERAGERRRLSAVAAPASLGPPLELPLDALPAGMRSITGALLGLRELGTTPPGRRPPLQGVGIGAATIVGRACVTTEPAEALARFEPGDIIVTAGTCPAWNVVLAAAGAVVTEEGGPLSHAAVIARELGLPAVIGCAGATTSIPDGASIEVDAAAGTVRIVANGQDGS